MVDSGQENIADLYYQKISDTTNPGPVLARFFGELTGRTIDKSHVIMMNKFIKSYGRFLVFFAILDISDVSNLGENIYPLMSAICKRRFEQAHSNSILVQYEKLDRKVNEYEKLRESMSKRKIKVPNYEDLKKGSDDQ